MSPAEIETMQRVSKAYDIELQDAGHLVMARPHRPPRTAKTVRMRAKKRHVMDGPFAETKEQLIGFLLIEADSMEEAVEMCAKIPLAGTGNIEMRGLSFHGDPELEQPKD